MDTIDRPPQTGDKGGHPKPALEDKLIESRASTRTAIVEPPTALLIGSIAEYSHRRSVRPKPVGYN